MSESSRSSQSAAHKEAFAENFPAFVEALESLYIKGNPSGRNVFRKAWPAAAEYIFAPEFLRIDAEGGGDKAEKEQYEIEAEEKREALLGLILDIQDKTVHGGMLQIEYVSAQIQQLGAGVSLYIFSPAVVEKVLPGTIKAPEEAEVPAAESPAQAEPRAEVPEAAPVVQEPAVFTPELGRKRKLFEIPLPNANAISYTDLVALAQQSEPAAAVSIKDIFNRLAQ